jgi:hypothetical protein
MSGSNAGLSLEEHRGNHPSGNNVCRRMATMMCLILEAQLAMKNDGPRMARPRRQKFSDPILPRDIGEHLLSQQFFSDRSCFFVNASQNGGSIMRYELADCE